MKKNTLIIVDFQKDFCETNGSLYVKGAPEAKEKIIELLKSGKISDVVFTLDWHPLNHCSFKENGGIWPIHCLQYSEGASIPNDLMKACIESNIPYQIIRKGEKEEQYSAFNDVRIENDMINVYNCGQIVSINANNQIIVCGLAGDYCVLDSIKGLVKCSPSVYKPGIAFIADTKPFNQFLKENDLKIFVK